MATNVKINNASDYLIPVGISQLGTIMFDNILFPAGTWFDLEGNEQYYSELKIDGVSFTVERTKNIIKTPVAGLDGTIKEYVNMSDFMINIRAIFAPSSIDPSEKEPVDLLNSFSELEKCPESVPILSKIINNTFNITRVIVEGFNMNRLGSDSWELNIDLISDIPVNLHSFG